MLHDFLLKYQHVFMVFLRSTIFQEISSCVVLNYYVKL